MHPRPLPVAVPADRSPANQSSSTIRPLLIIFGLLAATFAVYGQTLHFPFITFDDGIYVEDNWQVRRGLTWGTVGWAFTTFDAANWHPLTWLSLLLDSHLYGVDARGYHLTNLLLHATATVGAFLTLRLMTDALWRPALVAAAFGLHPLHVESVAWVAERKDVLSACFFVATLAAYAAWARRGGAWRYALALGLYFLGLLAKPMLVTLPAVLLLLDGWPLGRLAVGNFGRRVWEKAPFFTLTLASCVVTFIAQRAGGAVVPMRRMSLDHRLANAVLGYMDYLRLTFAPTHLTIFYPERAGWTWPALLGAVGLLAGITVAAVAWRWRAPYFLMGWCWFLGVLVPVIGLVQVGGQAIADRYVYLPHLGLFIALVWGGAALARRGGRAGLVVGGALAVVALVAAGVRAHDQTGAWRDSGTLYRRGLATTGPALKIYQMLGDEAVRRGALDEAEVFYQRALALEPLEVHSITELGILRLHQGRWREAADLLAPTLAHLPNDATNFNNFGLALLNVGGHDDAAAHALERALQIQPLDGPANFNLGRVRQSQGRTQEALALYERALEVKPAWPEVLRRAAFLRATSADERVRDGRRALGYVERAALLDGDARAGLDGFAAACAALGRWPEAVAAAEVSLRAVEAAEGGPESPAARERRGWLELYRAGQTLRR